MTYSDIIAALRSIGLGGTDVLTGETVINSAILEESINGDGGLTVSWKSTEGGLIRGGTMFMGFVMKENYVPTLGSDGIYMWSPKFSEPAVLLGKKNYGKKLTLHTDSWLYNVQRADDDVVVVVETDSQLVDDSSIYNFGDQAIVKNPENGHSSNKYLRFFDGDYWNDTLGNEATENYICGLTGGTAHYWRYVGGKWIDIGVGNGTKDSTVYTSPFCGKLGTIVDELNVFLAQNLPTYQTEQFSIVLRSENPVQAEAVEEIAALRETFISVTFDGSTLKELIDQIAEAADAHAYYVGRKIVIGRTRAYADTDFFNRFIILGGTKNMAKRTFNGQGYAAITQRLHLDEDDYPGSVIDLRSSECEAPFEAFLVFDDIYPKLNLNIATAKYCICYCLDDNGKKIPATNDPDEGTPRDWKLYAKWYITLELDGQPYTIDKKYIIQDKPLSLLFQSGPLTKRQFELTMLTEGSTERNQDFALQVDGDGNSLPESHTVTAGECYIILEASGDLLFPTLPASFDNGGLCPQAGNWATLVNVAIEDRFRIVAQKELLEKGMERAKLIYESKQPTISEERTFTDALTGEGSGDVPGLGEPYKGYIVTGVSENIITGAKTVTYGTFKPKSLMKSAIDRIEAFTLSGGEATTGKEVSTKTEGGTTVIYVHDENSDGSGGSSGTTSQSQSNAVRQAGGNINIKTVYEKVDGIDKKIKNSDLFAELIRRVWEHRLATSGASWSSVSLVFQGTGISGYVYCRDGETWKLYYNSVDVSVSGYADANALIAAFAAVNNVVGEHTITLTVGRPSEANMYDLYVEQFSVTVETRTVSGGIRGWLYNGEEWLAVLESTTAVIENLGNAIRMVVFGSAEGSIETMIEASGMLTTQNMVTLFSKVQGGTSLAETLAESVFAMGILYHVHDANGWHDVHYDSGNSEWVYNGDDYHTAGATYQGAESGIVPYSFANLRADRIDFTAGNFTIDASHILIGSNETLANLDNHINAVTQSSGMLTTGNFVELFARAITPNGNGTLAEVFMALGIKYRFSPSSGVYVDVHWCSQHNRWETDNHTEYTESYAIKPYSFVGIQADQIDFKGKTIGLTAQGGLTINGGTVAITSGSLTLDASSSIDMRSASVKVRSDNFSIYPTSGNNPIALFSNNKLNLTTDNASIDAESIVFTGKTINLSAATSLGLNASQITFGGQQIDIAAAQTLSFVGGTASGQNQGEIDFTAAKVKFKTDELCFLAPNGTTVVSLFGNDGRLNLSSGNCVMNISGLFTVNAGDISFNGQTVNMTGATVNLDTGTLNLNTGTLNLNASRITWNGQDVIPGGSSSSYDPATDSHFYVDSNGNVTMNNLTANNGTFTGTVVATNLFRNARLVTSSGNNPILNADIVLIGGYGINTASENINIILPTPSADIEGKVVTIHGIQNPASLALNSVYIKLYTANNSSYGVREPWNSAGRIFFGNNASNNLNSTAEMILRCDGTDWFLYKWVTMKTNADNTVSLIDSLAGINV